MAGSVNKVILIGNLGKDPEVRRLENGAIVANFSLATSESYLDKQTNERRTITDWHNIVVWRGLAEVAEKYVKKGHKVYIEGRLKNRSWQDKEGNTRYTTEILAENMTLLTPKDAPIDPNAPAYTEPKPPVFPTENNIPSPLDFGASSFDDDLPF